LPDPPFLFGGGSGNETNEHLAAFMATMQLLSSYMQVKEKWRML